MRPIVTMREALGDPRVLGTILPIATWHNWHVLLIALMGEELTPDERVIFKQLTGGREREPGQRVEEFWGVIGRRGGKSRAIASLAAYISTCCDHSANRAIGETLTILVLAQDQKSARTLFGYVRGVFDECPALCSKVLSASSDSIALVDGIRVEIRAASWRGLRGISSPLICCDEISVWRHESEASTNVDVQICAALRPSLATTQGMLVGISSPYARSGELFEVHREHFGPNGDPLILVAQAPSRVMNETLPQKVVDRALARDPARFAAEYLAEFRTDVGAYISRELIESAIDGGCVVRPPQPSLNYLGFVDAASGAGQDSFTFAIGHRETTGAGESLAVIDLVYERKPPFHPTNTVSEVCCLARGYRLSRVTGDRWSLGFVADAFKSNGVAYENAEKDKSQLYLEALPLFSSGRVRLVENERMLQQFTLLERKTSAAGRDRVEHPIGGTDDVSNAVAGCIASLAGAPTGVVGLITPQILEMSRRRPTSFLDERQMAQRQAAREARLYGWARR